MHAGAVLVRQPFGQRRRPVAKPCSVRRRSGVHRLHLGLLGPGRSHVRLHQLAGRRSAGRRACRERGECCYRRAAFLTHSDSTFLSFTRWNTLLRGTSIRDGSKPPLTLPHAEWPAMRCGRCSGWTPPGTRSTWRPWKKSWGARTSRSTSTALTSSGEYIGHAAARGGGLTQKKKATVTSRADSASSWSRSPLRGGTCRRRRSRTRSTSCRGSGSRWSTVR